MVTVQVVPEAVSQPLQLVKIEPKDGVAVRVATVPLLYAAAQVAPQLIPAGLEVTVPLPMPKGLALLTVRAKLCRVRVAVTDLAALMVTLQVVPETASQPLQPANVDPPAGVA